MHSTKVDKEDFKSFHQVISLSKCESLSGRAGLSSRSIGIGEGTGVRSLTFNFLFPLLPRYIKSPSIYFSLLF